MDVAASGSYPVAGFVIEGTETDGCVQTEHLEQNINDVTVVDSQEGLLTMTACVRAPICLILLRRKQAGTVNTICLSLCTIHHVFGVQFIKNLQSNLCTAITRQNTRRNNSPNLHAQDTTALQSQLFLLKCNVYWP
jgi:hypothetical protein